ncbi:hypothetical protein LA080_013873 [Diaporthe eres]|nr:hypothetical protein LA080_013873 [Diaporthe eres]
MINSTRLLTHAADPLDISASCATEKPFRGGKGGKWDDEDDEISLQQRRVRTIPLDAEPPGHGAQDNEPDNQRHSSRGPEPFSHLLTHVGLSVVSSGVLVDFEAHANVPSAEVNTRHEGQVNCFFHFRHFALPREYLLLDLRGVPSHSRAGVTRKGRTAWTADGAVPRAVLTPSELR